MDKKILSTLALKPKTIEEISKDTQIDQIQLLEILSLLELQGLLRTYPGGRLGRKVSHGA
jgi:predicted transcriptional regulator